jgi:hypothetical protein
MTVIEAGPALTAYREDEEPWRIERLRELLVKIEGLPILSLCERKGCLSVNWGVYPTTAQLVQVVDAWKELFEENSDHFVEGMLLIGDEFNDA